MVSSRNKKKTKKQSHDNILIAIRQLLSQNVCDDYTSSNKQWLLCMSVGANGESERTTEETHSLPTNASFVLFWLNLMFMKLICFSSFCGLLFVLMRECEAMSELSQLVGEIPSFGWLVSRSVVGMLTSSPPIGIIHMLWTYNIALDKCNRLKATVWTLFIQSSHSRLAVLK